MAEYNDSPEGAPEAPVAGPQRRLRALSARRPGRLARASKDLATAAPAASVSSRRRSPLRSVMTIAVVTGLVAAAGLPAYAAFKPEEATVTLQQLAKDGAQTLVIASDVQAATVERESYAATTPEEIAQAKAAAAAEARARAAAAARSSSSSGSSAMPAGVPLVAPGSGIVRRPLPYFNNFGTPYAGHRGVDYMVERGTPIYSVADGVVVQSTDGGGALGVTITIAHNINGTSVRSTYAHMLPGSRQVGVGSTVSAGQFIGQVSDTGLAFGTHLHLMIQVNGAVVNAESWLVANAG